MKRTGWIIFSCILIFGACTKPGLDLPVDNGCIERVTISVNDYSINAVDVPVVKNLFQRNNIDDSKFRFYQYIHDTLQTLYPPYSQFDEKSVRVDQYLKGVRLFTGDMIFNFLSDKLSYQAGNISKGTSLNTFPVLSLGQLRKLFLDNALKFDNNNLTDSCLKAEFGYYNLNAGTGDESEKLIKVWRVTLKNSVYPSEYPIAYYNDDNGNLIVYDNGIRTFGK